jgi:hypothetical protein
VFVINTLRVVARTSAQYAALLLFGSHVELVDLSRALFNAATLSYQPLVLPYSAEVVVVTLGPLVSFALFGLLAGAAAAFHAASEHRRQQAWRGAVDVVSQLPAGPVHFWRYIWRFVVLSGIAAVLDPLLAALPGATTAEGMAPEYARLGALFLWHDGAAGWGYAITGLIYLLYCTASLFCLRLYVATLHGGGIIPDLVDRLLGSGWPIPRDAEVSQQELLEATIAAERWRGEHGERRKTVVYQFSQRSDGAGSAHVSAVGPAAGTAEIAADVPSIATHIAIYTLRPGGHRDIFRQFLATDEGVILELPSGSAAAFVGVGSGLAAVAQAVRSGGVDGTDGVKDMLRRLGVEL